MWTPSLLTATLIWFGALGLGRLFQLDRVWQQRRFLSETFLKVVGLTALAEFLINLFVLPLSAELVLVPVAAFLGALGATPSIRLNTTRCGESLKTLSARSASPRWVRRRADLHALE